MVNHSAVLFKLDSGLLDRLDFLCSDLGCKRNRLINFAIRTMVDNMSSINQCRLTSIYQKAFNNAFVDF